MIQSCDEASLKKSKKQLKKGQFKVYLRLRPLQNCNKQPSIGINPHLKCVKGISDDENLNFKINEFQNLEFDEIFDDKCSQNNFFQQVIKPILGEALNKRKNALVFAYGVTNSGKTHTIIGEEYENENEIGILPRIIDFLLQTKTKIIEGVQKNEQTTIIQGISICLNQFKNIKNIKITFENFEIYNEEIFDLQINSRLKLQNKLQLKETQNKRILIPNITSNEIFSFPQIALLIQQAILNREIQDNNINQSSSRSQCCFKVNIETIYFNNISYTTSLLIVDLAGSERAKKTLNSGQKLAESCHINSSLFTLGKCIRALRAGDDNVPYRDSKLTRILKEYFVEKNNIIMVVHINPEIECTEENLNVLKIASAGLEAKLKSTPLLVSFRNFEESEFKRDVEKEKYFEQIDNLFNNFSQLENQSRIDYKQKFLEKEKQFNFILKEIEIKGIIDKSKRAIERFDAEFQHIVQEEDNKIQMAYRLFEIFKLPECLFSVRKSECIEIDLTSDNKSSFDNFNQIEDQQFSYDHKDNCEKHKQQIFAQQSGLNQEEEENKCEKEGKEEETRTRFCQTPFKQIGFTDKKYQSYPKLNVKPEQKEISFNKKQEEEEGKSEEKMAILNISEGLNQQIEEKTAQFYQKSISNVNSNNKQIQNSIKFKQENQTQSDFSVKQLMQQQEELQEDKENQKNQQNIQLSNEKCVKTQQKYSQKVQNSQKNQQFSSQTDAFELLNLNLQIIQISEDQNSQQDNALLYQNSKISFSKNTNEKSDQKAQKQTSYFQENLNSNQQLNSMDEKEIEESVKKAEQLNILNEKMEQMCSNSKQKSNEIGNFGTFFDYKNEENQKEFEGKNNIVINERQESNQSNQVSNFSNFKSNQMNSEFSNNSITGKIKIFQRKKMESQLQDQDNSNFKSNLCLKYAKSIEQKQQKSQIAKTKKQIKQEQNQKCHFQIQNYNSFENQIDLQAQNKRGRSKTVFTKPKNKNKSKNQSKPISKVRDYY